MWNAKCKNEQKRIVPVVKILDVECAVSNREENILRMFYVKKLNGDDGPAKQKKREFGGRIYMPE